MPRQHWQGALVALHRTVLAYLFERFPKYSQTFCYREVTEMFRQGEAPLIFSLRAPDPGPEPAWDRQILSAVHYLPEGPEFARCADEAARCLSAAAGRTLRGWRGKRDSLRLHQAVYLGLRLRAASGTHLHTHFAGMAARTAFWIHRFFGIPYSLTVHANDLFVPDEFEIGLPDILGRASAVVVVSDFAAEYIREKFPAVAGRVHRIYNGIRLEEFTRADRSDAPPLIVAVGRLIQKKGFDVLIEACRLLREEGEVFRCEIIGDGPLQATLQAQVARYALEDFVRLAGAQPQREIATRLGQATLFCLPCRVDQHGGTDNLPTVIMEAMAASLPVISTRVAGIPEMVIEGQSGLLVTQNDVSATASAIKRLLREPDLARAFGMRGRGRAARFFSIATNVQVLRQLLNQSASGSLSQPPSAEN